MGFSFTNIQVRYASAMDAAALDSMADRIAREFVLKPVSNPEEADVVTAIYHPEGAEWVTIVSDVFDADMEKQTALAQVFSKEYGVPALAIACYDSDYLTLNWLDENRGQDFFAANGSAAGMGLTGMRRSSFAAWKAVLPDAEAFREAMRRQYIFAEKALADTAEQLRLPVEQGQACLELLEELPGAKLYYYAAAVQMDDTEKPRLQWCGSGTVDGRIHVDFSNAGGASRGVSVTVMGKEALAGVVTLAETMVEYQMPNGEYKRIPVQFERVISSDGTEILQADVPEISLRSVPKSLPSMKVHQAMMDRKISLCFDLTSEEPEWREEAKMTVAMSPKENSEGRAEWTESFKTRAEYQRLWQEKLGAWYGKKKEQA